jgi:hypothetical protein
LGLEFLNPQASASRVVRGRRRRCRSSTPGERFRRLDILASGGGLDEEKSEEKIDAVAGFGAGCGGGSGKCLDLVVAGERHRPLGAPQP